MPPANVSPWFPGAHVVTREIVHDKVWTVRPVTVVRDDPDLIALYMAPGTIYKHPRLPDRDEIPKLLIARDWRLVDVAWTGGGALYLSRPGEQAMVVAFWHEDHVTLRSWYVNLQTPLVRSRLGFEYLDLALDIVISPDRATWRWKDEEDLAVLVERGLISPERAGALRALGERIVATRHDPDSLLAVGWERWRPPPEWHLPTVPPGWDVMP